MKLASGTGRLLLLFAAAWALAMVLEPPARGEALNPVQRNFVRIYLDTRHCMTQNVRLFEQLGEQAHNKLVPYLMATCGTVLRLELVGHGDMTPTEANATLRELAELSIKESKEH